LPRCFRRGAFREPDRRPRRQRPRVHREAIASALALLRSTAEVVSVEPTALASEVARRRPDFLIRSELGPELEAGKPAWVLLNPAARTRPWRASAGRRA
jgi:hypothetical protein